MIKFNKGYAILIIGLLFASLVISFGCKSKEPADKVVFAEFQVYSPSGTFLRKETITPENPVILAEGENCTIGPTRYVAKSRGGELRIVNGQIKVRNIQVVK